MEDLDLAMDGKQLYINMILLIDTIFLLNSLMNKESSEIDITKSQ